MVAISDGPDAIKQAALRRDIPITDGIIGGTTRQEGHVMNLVPEKSLVHRKDKVGL